MVTDVFAVPCVWYTDWVTCSLY